jgi:hypothetical protein
MHIVEAPLKLRKQCLNRLPGLQVCRVIDKGRLTITAYGP